jgi:iron complex outermembrane recepter protein
MYPRATYFAFLLFLLCGSSLHALDDDPAPTSTTCTQSESGVEHSLYGTVLDNSGAAVPGVEIRASCGSFEKTIKSASDGTFSLPLKAGGYNLSVKASGFLSQSRNVDMQNNDMRMDLSLQLEKLRTTVSVNASGGYLETQSPMGTKTDTPMLEIPQSITVVSRKLMNEQQVIKLDDAIKNVAGVVPGGYYDGWDYYRIRGFDASFNTYLDGLRGPNGTQDETYGLQSVEVLKGPSSSLYGQSVLGGIVNLTSKRPQPDGFANLDFTAGSFGLLSPSGDVGGSLNRSRTFYGRLVALYRSQDSFTDYAYYHRVYVAPSLTWQITPSTTLTMLARYQRDHTRAAYPLPADGTVFANPNGPIPISRYVGEIGGDNNTVHEENKHIGYLFTHAFSDAVVFHQTMRITGYNQFWNHLLYPGYLGDDQQTLYRYPLDYWQQWNNYAVDSTMEASFHTGKVRHKFIGGYDFFRNPQTFSGLSSDTSTLAGYMPLNLYNPVYGTPYPSPLIPAYGGSSLVQYSGIYLQDQVHLTSRLIVTGGGRFNFATNRTDPDPSINKYAFTPRVGINYLLRSDLSAYASYSRSFLPQTGQIYSPTNSSGTSAAPETGRQWEVGLKSSLLGSRLNATLSLFDLVRNNVLTMDIAHPNFFVLSGQQRSQGVELETSTVLRTGWDLTAAYAYTFARITDDNSIPLGTPTQNAPRNMFSFWTHYEIQRGWAKGVSFGLGTRYYSRQGGDLYNTFQLPPYGLTDASASYRRGPFHIQLNAYNLGDKRYYTGSYDIVYVKPGSPRAVRMNVGWSF